MRTSVAVALNPVKAWPALLVAVLLMLALALPRAAHADSVETVAAVLVGAALIYAAQDDDRHRYQRGRYDDRHDHRYYDRRHGHSKHFSSGKVHQRQHYDQPFYYSNHKYRDRDDRREKGGRGWKDKGRGYGHDKASKHQARGGHW